MAEIIASQSDKVHAFINRAYTHCFHTPIDTDSIPPGLISLINDTSNLMKFTGHEYLRAPMIT